MDCDTRKRRRDPIRVLYSDSFEYVSDEEPQQLESDPPVLRDNRSECCQEEPPEAGQETTAAERSKRKRKYRMISRPARTPEKRGSKKRVLIVDPSLVGLAYGKGCCMNQCMWKNFTIQKVIECRRQYAEKNEYERSLFVMNLVEGAVFRSEESIYYNWKVDGMSVCQAALLSIYGFSKTKITVHKPVKIRKFIEISLGLEQEVEEWNMEHLNHPPTVHGNTGYTRPHQLQKRTAIEDMEIWCENYFTMLGDVMPDTDEIHMPSYLSTEDIHREYVLEMMDKGFHQEDLPSLERFRKMKRDCFPQIKFPRHTTLRI